MARGQGIAGGTSKPCTASRNLQHGCRGDGKRARKGGRDLKAMRSFEILATLQHHNMLDLGSHDVLVRLPQSLSGGLSIKSLLSASMTFLVHHHISPMLLLH